MLKHVDKIYVLLISNSVESCKEDVRRMKILLSKYTNKIKTYIDCDIEEKISNFCKSIRFTKNNLLLIHYSGHGKMVGKKINNKMEMISTWINSDGSLTHSDNIINILTKVDCFKILISDSCHSGNFTNSYTAESPLLFIGSSSLINLTNEYNIFHNKKSGILVCLFEYFFNQISLKQLTLSNLNEMIKSFFTLYNVKASVIIKTFNI